MCRCLWNNLVLIDDLRILYSLGLTALYAGFCSCQMTGSSHSSRTLVAKRLKQPTRNSNAADHHIAPYLVLLHMGFTIASHRCRPSGALLPHRFTLAGPPAPEARIGLRNRWAGGLLSVALSVASPRLAVSKHAVRWSPDFPPPADKPPGATASGPPAGRRLAGCAAVRIHPRDAYSRWTDT